MTHRIRYGTRLWHVMGRGVNGCAIFGDPSDRELFLGQLGQSAGLHDVRLHAFVLMTNHYHFLLTGDWDAVSRFEYRLLFPYVRAFNRRWERYGPLFQGRFLSVPIFNPRRALETSCYVHQNPVPPRLADRATDYPWSSIRFYTGSRGEPVPSWMDTDLINGILSSRLPGVSTSYDRLMDLYVGDENDTWLGALTQEAVETMRQLKSRAIG